MTGLNHSLEKTGEVEVKGCRLHYRYYEPHDEDKAKRTPLVVLHGGPGATHSLLYNGLSSLCDELPVLFYDQRGSFFSPVDVASDSLMTVPQFSQDLDAVVSDAGLNHFSLLAHSFGGVVALDYLLKSKERVLSLVLSSPLLSSKIWQEDCAKLLASIGYDPDLLWRLENEGKADDVYFQEAEKVFMKMFGGCRSEKYAAVCAKHGQKFNVDVYNAMWGKTEFACTGTLKNISYFEHLSTIQTPTLFVCGEYDSARPETMRKAARMMQDASVVEIPDAGHLTFLDNRKVYLKAVRNHLSTLDV